MHYIKDNTKIYVYSMPILDSRMYIILNDKNENEALIIDPTFQRKHLLSYAHFHMPRYCSPILIMTIFPNELASRASSLYTPVLRMLC